MQLPVKKKTLEIVLTMCV